VGTDRGGCEHPANMAMAKMAANQSTLFICRHTAEIIRLSQEFLGANSQQG
jgi:hypothetical protein